MNKEYIEGVIEEFDKKFPHKIAEVIDDFGSTIKTDIKKLFQYHLQKAYEQGVKEERERIIKMIEK